MALPTSVRAALLLAGVVRSSIASDASPSPAVASGGALTLPRGPKLACKWDRTQATLNVSWEMAVGPEPLPYPADVYEIQISASPFARAAAISTVGGLQAQLGLDLLLPNTTYYLSMRAHAGWAFATGHFMGIDTWGKLGPQTACTTGMQDTSRSSSSATAASAPASDHGGSDGRSESFVFESWRLSEYAAGEVDYLLNHDSADAAGLALLFTALAQYEYRMGDLVLQNSWTGGSTAQLVLTTYCIEALRPEVPGNDTTRGDPRFADYQSCNNQVDKTSASCSCVVATDRLWGRLPLSPSCEVPATKTPCPTDGSDGCTCTCTPQQRRASAEFTGMIDVFARDDENDNAIGKWYSHPAGAACVSNEKLGAVRPDGSRCTWKQSQSARTMRGWQLYAAGLNASGLALDKLAGCLSNAPSCSPVAAQIRENVGVMKSVLDSAPLAPWKCGGDN